VRHSTHWAGIISAMLLLVSCGGDAGPSPTDSGSVKAVPDGITVLVGHSGRFAAVVIDAQGDTVTGSTLSWSTKNPAVATIASDGTVTGQSVGLTQAIVTTGDLADTAAVVVVDQLSLEVLPADTAINVFATATFTVVATNGAGDPVPAPPVAWSSSNTSVANIDESGVATGVGVGFTNIVATYGLISSAPAVLQVNAAGGQCYGIASATGFQGSIAYGFKAVDQTTPAGFQVSADDNGSLHATMTRSTNGPFIAAWVGELSGASSASVTQKLTNGNEVSTYTSTSGVMMPQPALGGLPKLTLLVDLQQCTYRVVSGASLATLLTDQFGNRIASVDIVATIQFAGAVPQNWQTGGIARGNGTMGGHSTVWGALHPEADALMPLGFATQLFTQSDPEQPAGEASGGFDLQVVP